MKPLLLADWNAIHRRFCVLLWLVAIGLAMVILLHFAERSPACASTAAAPGASGCVKRAKQAHIAPARPFLASARSTDAGRR